MFHISYLILGSNLGDREGFLKKAVELINTRAGKILESSSVYETEPWEITQNSKFKIQNYYLNKVIKIQTELTPPLLMSKLSEIENKLGRKREVVNSNKLSAISNQQSAEYAPRTIDIDILFYDDIIINSEKSSTHFLLPATHYPLIIPHPLLHKRKFVLVPLCEIAPDFIHPVMKVSVKQLLEECDDEKEVRIFRK